MRRSAVIAVAAAALATASGCLGGADDEVTCTPGPYFVGAGLELPAAAAVGDRYMVTWDQVEPGTGVTIRRSHGVMLDATGVPDETTRFDFDPDVDVNAVISGPDRALVFTTHRAPTGYEDTYELRDDHGVRIVGPTDASELGMAAVFDGDAFVVTTTAGFARMALDGSVGPPLGLATTDLEALGATAGVTWVVFVSDDHVLSVARIARGGGVLDPAPIVLDADVWYARIATRANEAGLIAVGNSSRTVTWYRLGDDGTVTGAAAIGEAGVPQPGVLVADASGYLVVSDGGTAIHVDADGTVGTPVQAFEQWTGNSLISATSSGGSIVVYDWQSRMGIPPAIKAHPVAGAALGQPTIVATVDGEVENRDCGCAAGGAGGGPSLAIVIAALALISRRRRPG